LGVTGGRFLSIISSAAHPRWPLRHPSWIWLPLIFWPTPGSTGLIFSVACWGWLQEGSIWLISAAATPIVNLHHTCIPLLPKPYLPYTHRQLPIRGAYTTPCV
jgi:hypothetical protein